MDQLQGRPIRCIPSTNKSSSAGAEDPPVSCSSPTEGTELSPWALGHQAGPFLSGGAMLVSASQWTGSNFHSAMTRGGELIPLFSGSQLAIAFHPLGSCFHSHCLCLKNQ